MTPTSQMVEVKKVKLRTARRGNSNAPSILFLHGGAGSMEDFDPIIDRFSEYDCVMMDSRGHGGSTLEDTDLSYPVLASDAETIVRHYQLKRPFIVGHSDGGIAGLHVAARKNVAISGLVTLSSHGYPPPEELLEKVYRPLTAQKWRQRFPEWVAVYEELNPEPDFDRLFNAMKAMWIDTGDNNYPYPVLSQIAAPVLILCGDKDHLVSRKQTLYLAKALPQASLGLFPFGSHVFHQEHPDRVAPFIHEFISQSSKDPPD